MSLKVWHLDDHMRPFDHIICPVCEGTVFVSVEPCGGVWCDGCNAVFSCRDTAGDPGLVVDCRVEDIHDKKTLLALMRKVCVLTTGHWEVPTGGKKLDDLLAEFSQPGHKVPIYFYMVCKEPQEDGSWTDVRSWNMCSLDRRLSLHHQIRRSYQ